VVVAHLLAKHGVDGVAAELVVIGQDVAPRPIFRVRARPSRGACLALLDAELVVGHVIIILVVVVIGRELRLEGESLHQCCFKISIGAEVLFFVVVGRYLG